LGGLDGWIDALDEHHNYSFRHPGLFDDCDGADVCAFEPRKCEPLREHTRLDSDGDGAADTDALAGVICTDGAACTGGGVPFINFETMNLGIKSYAADGSIIVNDDDFVATKLSVELDPFDCDIDGDGEPDATDDEPLNPAVQ